MSKEKKQPKISPEDHAVEEEFSDLMDLEYLEMIELIEMMKKGDLTEEELKRFEYIRKTRENLYGGDA